MSGPHADAVDRDPDVLDLIRRALKEDVGAGDVTTRALVRPSTRVKAAVIAREACVAAGMSVFARVLTEVDPAIVCTPVKRDGARAAADESLVEIHGPAAGILTGERTALNFLQRLTGIATLTRRFVDAVAGTGVTILDTRKTTPTMRALEKYAVRCGGGENHRMGLYDRVLIKDNHRRLWKPGAESRLDLAVREARRVNPGLEIEVEIETEEELAGVLKAPPDWVLLDNMAPDKLRRLAGLCAGRCRVEASGGITLGNVAEVAACGVDAISLGCLTHSAPAVDLSLEIAL